MVGLACAAGAVVLRTPGAAGRSGAQLARKGSKRSTTTPTTITAASQRVEPGAGDLFTTPTVAAYMAGTTEDVTAAVYDDATGVTSLYRPGVVQVTASIMKVEILATLLAQGQPRGQALTTAEQPLAVNMIEESDNDDAQALWDTEGGAAAVGVFDTAAGLTQTDPDAAGYWGLSTTTAADQVQLLRTVVYPNQTLTAASQAYELSLMEHVDPDEAWGVSGGCRGRLARGAQERVAAARQRRLAGQQRRVRRRPRA